MLLLLGATARSASLLTPSQPPPARAAVRLAASSTAATSSSSPSLKLPSPIETIQRLNSEEARQLQRELLELALEQDPKVVIERSLDLARALQVVGTETITGLSANSIPEPPVILRRMCEELGATYVKLGQFIASSPTLVCACCSSNPRLSASRQPL